LQSPVLQGQGEGLSASEVALLARSLAGIGQADGTAVELESVVWRLGMRVFGTTLKGLPAPSVIAFMRAVTWCTEEGNLSDDAVQFFDNLGPYLLERQYPPDAPPGSSDLITVAAGLARMGHKDVHRVFVLVPWESF
ncbi:hypothetical protein Pmar_PMAR027005, partial [Perkinsus marinus ATCC 50983]